ncbi:MAG: hypothetical protein Q7S79_04025 [bacterium]|nr:hypothetical protein [bacterium]
MTEPTSSEKGHLSKFGRRGLLRSGTGAVVGAVSGVVARVAWDEFGKNTNQLAQDKLRERLKDEMPELLTFEALLLEVVHDRLAGQIGTILPTFLERPKVDQNLNSVEYSNKAGQMLRVSHFFRNGIGERLTYRFRFNPGNLNIPDLYLDRITAAGGKIIMDQVAYTLDRNKNLTFRSSNPQGVFSKEELQQVYSETCKIQPTEQMRWDFRQEGVRGYAGTAQGRSVTCDMGTNGSLEAIATQPPRFLDLTSTSRVI